VGEINVIAIDLYIHAICCMKKKIVIHIHETIRQVVNNQKLI